ncbi:helix-turn-helix transcriptional regulator [Bacillus sp. JCM 19041]|uniref:helix-turn-helix transcriptional regulator n=1 Tax=Bacillus sp. JCM 19041 TaxID=1460637 RepID=UPI00336A8363
MRLARQLKVSRGYVSQILNGTRSPSPKTAKQIAEFFNIEFDDIFFIKHAC